MFTSAVNSKQESPAASTKTETFKNEHVLPIGARNLSNDIAECSPFTWNHLFRRS